MSAVFSARSGAPFTVNLGVDRANVGAGPAQRPDALGDPNLPGGQRTPERWFDTVGVRAASAVHFRDRPPEQRRRPGFRHASTCRWPRASGSAEGGSWRCGWDVFNALNRANFDLPNRIFGTPNFGRIFSAKSAREMQLGVRLSL